MRDQPNNVVDLDTYRASYGARPTMAAPRAPTSTRPATPGLSGLLRDLVEHVVAGAIRDHERRDHPGDVA